MSWCGQLSVVRWSVVSGKLSVSWSIVVGLWFLGFGLWPLVFGLVF